LHFIARLDLLRLLFGEISIPEAVRQEIPRVSLPDFICVRPVFAGTTPALRLGPGETEGLQVVGVLGILLKAKELGFLVSVREEIEKLSSLPFHISPRLLAHVLHRAGELRQIEPLRDRVDGPVTLQGRPDEKTS
jgi:predicted nucleic acid-binding protein